MKKIIAISILLALAGCFHSSDDKDGAGAMLLSWTETEPISGLNETEKYYVTEDTYSYCMNGVIQQETYTDTVIYEIFPGYMYTWWAPYSCTAIKYLGNNPTIIGTWTFPPFSEYFANAPGPMANVADCQAQYDMDNPNGYTLEEVENVSGTITFSATSITTNVAFNPCLARGNYYDFSEDAAWAFNATDQNITIVENTCTNFAVQIGAKSADVSYSNLKRSEQPNRPDYTMTFTHEAVTCSYAHVEGPDDEPTTDADCVDTGIDPSEEAWDAFKACVENSGFYTTMPEPLPGANKVRSRERVQKLFFN